MMEQKSCPLDDNEPFKGAFLKDLLDQLRVNYPYGSLETKKDEDLLMGLIRTKAPDGALCAQLDAGAFDRIRAFYRTIAVSLEREMGGFFQVVMEVSSEGFGRVVIYSVRLIVLEKTLRDAQTCGFASMERMLIEAKSTLDKAKAVFLKFRDAALAP
jgi:probable nitrogen fixation protein